MLGSKVDVGSIKIRPSWLVVGVALVLFLIGVAGKFNFSSVGIWNTYLDRKESVPGLIAGTPKFIRSDEWQLGVPWLLSQYNSKPQWPTNNPSVGAESSALLVGLPTKHWSAIFRPAHWGFFLFDFERGFSWLWMFRSVVVFAALTLLCAQIGAGSLLVGLAGAIWIFYSAFVQWWLASVAELLAYFSLACLSLRYLFLARSKCELFIASGLFVLFSVAFALVIYPPYQVPLLYLGCAILPFLLEGVRSSDCRFRSLPWICVAVAVTISAGVVVSFLAANGEAVHLMSHTVYPGSRVSLGGEMTLVRYFSGFFDILLKQDLFPAQFGNMSEASSFIVLWPLALLRITSVKGRIERWRCAPLIAYLLGVSFWAFVGVPEWLATVSGWSLVPSFRGSISWGLGGIFLCLALMARSVRPGPRSASALISLSILLVVAFAIYYRQEIVLEVSNRRYVYAVGSVVALATAVIVNRIGLVLLALCVACIAPNGLVNPLMRGVPVISESTLVRAVKRFDLKGEGLWMVIGDSRYAQVAKASGRRIVNGSQYVPNLELWGKVDPQGLYRNVYNRYAHVGVRFAASGELTRFDLVAPDAWHLTIDPCGGALEALGVTHLLWVEYDAAQRFSCLERIYVESNLAVYKVRHTPVQAPT